MDALRAELKTLFLRNAVRRLFDSRRSQALTFFHAARSSSSPSSVALYARAIR